MILLVGCSEQDLVAVHDGPSAFDTGNALPRDTATEDTSLPPPRDKVPWAQILEPEPGVPVEGCAGLSLLGQVGGGDGALVATFYADGVPMVTGAPDADGFFRYDATTVATGTIAWTLEVADEDGDVARDAREVTWNPSTPEGWDLDVRWERSAMADRVMAGSMGECLGAALALPTDGGWVWDSGDYTPAGWEVDGLAAGRTWASWDQAGSVDCHLFRLTVTLPECPYSAVRIASPWFTGVPINDNLYIFVDGVEAWRSGTSYDGVSGAGPREVDTWMGGTIPDLPAEFFVPGEQEILLVTEEYASWGGLGYLEATLLP